ncbi:uncharacterized protein LOC111657508 isoform X1 [Seriola lalandi dorsalis]|uniref:uncharacterized protein LOC111657508 isoform X1 n=1 Tax=Seriola lalandi dorsalis TaxID=1841481 RepID=UPI000C6FCA9D|nr:uncharacterized protein LOC111657508 isoform X1 [Seriola lalandi dorsalis]
MSSEKNPEVAGCDASIMKNVWEIRLREYGQKMQLEQKRMEKSALPSINQDWANRTTAKLRKYKRVERKTKPTETQEDSNIWKSKQPQVPPTLPCGAGAGPGPRGQSGQSRGLPTQALNYKDKKGQHKNFNRLQLLMFITQTQPSAMLWGKSWKYNKSLPSPAEGITARSDWSQCWMFATQQPYSEAGKPWPNRPNMMDPRSLHLWKKPDHSVIESELNLSLPTEEWHMSWRKSNKNNKEDTSSVNRESIGYFTLLLETEHHSALCSSEWSESWRSTKQASQQEHITVPNDGLIDESIANKQDKNSEMSFRWEECWRLVNHHGCNKSQLSQVQRSPSPKWSNPWTATMVVLNNHKNSDPSGRQDPSDTYDDFSEWSESWQVTKNISKPCEEIEKVLKAYPPRMETAVEAEMVEEKPKGPYSTSEKADPYYEQLKHNIIYQSKTEFTQFQQLLLKQVENVLSSEWRDSWKTLKNRMRVERRRIKPDPLRPFRMSLNRANMKFTTSEWKDSWKFIFQSLRQEPELWQQDWSTTPQIRVDWARDQKNFATLELSKNGPSVERSWGESWRFSRHQYQSEPEQGNAQTSQERSSMAFHNSDDSWTQKKYVRSASEWRAAWMVSESQFHHDKPYLTQWREAWKWSVFHAEHWIEQVLRDNLMEDVLEIQPLKKKISLQRAKARMSPSFDNQMFRERYSEKQWSASWRAGSLLNHQMNHYVSSETPGKKINNATQQQHAINSEHRSKWGRSFRLANPMPHVEKPWVESSPNPCHYTVMWSRENDIQNKINKSFNKNPAILRLWGNSHQFLQGASVEIKDKSKSKEPVDPRVIITKKTKISRYLYSNIKMEKQSERKWAGCHLLGKTQPRPRRGSASVKKLKMEDETEDKFFEEWVESWRLLVQPGSLKKIPMKSLASWAESWKFLLQPYQPMNDPKAK